ncbi:hypothetical protein JEZ13_09985 [bacterium]|nr:hypothetical protein [bacterium]
MNYIKSLIKSVKLEIEAQKRHFGSRSYYLFSGTKGTDQNSNLYIFQHNDLIELADNSPATISINGEQHDCFITSGCHNYLSILLTRDIGEHIEEATLILKPWIVLEELLKRLNEHSESENFFKNSFDLIKSKFSKELHISQPKYGEANQSQILAINNAMEMSHSYFWGAARTGKSFTISKIIENFLQIRKRVLLVSSSNNSIQEAFTFLSKQIQDKKHIESMTLFESALDCCKNTYNNLLNSFTINYKIKMLLSPELARINDIYKILSDEENSPRNESLIKELEELNNCIREETTSILSDSGLIGTTINQLLTRKFFDSQKFNIVIFDEAELIPFPILFWIATKASEKLVIVGTYPQIPLMGFSKNNSYYQSNIFDRLDMRENCHKCNAAMLKVQYGITHDIFSLINKDLHGNSLIHSVEKKGQLFVDKVSDTMPIVFINNCVNRPILFNISPTRRVNLHNAIVCSKIVKSLLANNDSDFSIGIFTTYSDQALFISKILKEDNLLSSKKVSIHSVPSFDTKRYSIVIFDTVDAEGSMTDYSLINDEDNKASKMIIDYIFTRSKDKLYIIGDNFYFKNYHPYETLFNTITRNLCSENNTVTIDNFSSVFMRYNKRTKGELYNSKDILQDIKNAKNELIIVSSKANLLGMKNFFRNTSSYDLESLDVTFLLNDFKNKKGFNQLQTMIIDKGFTLRTIDCHNKSNFVIIDKRILWFGRFDIINNRNDSIPYKVEYYSLIKALIDIITHEEI